MAEQVKSKCPECGEYTWRDVLESEPVNRGARKARTECQDCGVEWWSMFLTWFLGDPGPSNATPNDTGKLHSSI